MTAATCTKKPTHHFMVTYMELYKCDFFVDEGGGIALEGAQLLEARISSA